jgi:hypothetical protein
MQNITDDLVLLFKTNGTSLSVSQVLQRMGADVLIGIIDAIRTVVVGLVNMGALILQDFKAYINYPIDIPIFSALYKEFISGGTELSVLDALALLLAIPVTILSKLATGKAPPDLTGLDYDKLVDGKITDPTLLLQVNGFMGISAVTANTLKGFIDGLSAAASLSMSDVNEEHQDITVLKKFKGPHSLETLLLRHQQQVGLANPIAVDWRLALGTCTKVAAIPTDPSQPGYPIRWISWLISCGDTLIAAAIRKVTVEGVPATLRAQVLAIIQGINAIINFALVSAINGLEFTTPSYPGKDTAATTLRTVSSVFDLISTLGTDGEILTKG